MKKSIFYLLLVVVFAIAGCSDDDTDSHSDGGTTDDDYVAIESLTVTRNFGSYIFVGEEFSYTYTFTPANATNQDLTITVADTSIAECTQNKDTSTVDCVAKAAGSVVIGIHVGALGTTIYMGRDDIVQVYPASDYLWYGLARYIADTQNNGSLTDTRIVHNAREFITAYSSYWNSQAGVSIEVSNLTIAKTMVSVLIDQLGDALTDGTINFLSEDFSVDEGSDAYTFITSNIHLGTISSYEVIISVIAQYVYEACRQAKENGTYYYSQVDDIPLDTIYYYVAGALCEFLLDETDNYANAIAFTNAMTDPDNYMTFLESLVSAFVQAIATYQLFDETISTDFSWENLVSDTFTEVMSQYSGSLG